LEGEVSLHLEVDKSVRPVQMSSRRLPIGVRDKVRVELKRLKDLGILVPVSEPTEWVSALLAVARPDGRVRICVDTKPSLNRALIRATHYMPTIDDILPQLARVRVMSTVDTADGFWHLKLDDESSKLTTMETPCMGSSSMDENVFWFISRTGDIPSTFTSRFVWFKRHSNHC